MTNTQLYLSIGLPTLLILVGLLLNWSATRELGVRFSSLEGKVAAHDAKFVSIDAQFASISVQFAAINATLASIDRRLGMLESDLRQFYQSIGKLEGRMDALERK